MKCPFRKRKRAAVAKKECVQRPPLEITVNTAANPYEEDGLMEKNLNEERWAIQKVFASHLLKISRKHLGDNHHNHHHHELQIRRRSSLVDASTASEATGSDLRPEDRFLGESVKPTPKPSFALVCGNSDIDTFESSRLHWCAPESLPGLRCTEPQLKVSQMQPPPVSPGSFWCPLLSLFPESYGQREGDNDGPVEDTHPKYGSFFFLAQAFRGKRDTKRNGIPNVITVVVSNPERHRRSSCCGSIDVVTKEELALKRSHKVLNQITSFDSSLLRMEESLMRANLEADVEEKYEFPNDLDQDPTTESDATGTSTISTHSSLKFGASIIKVPSAMAQAEPSPNVDPILQ